MLLKCQASGRTRRGGLTRDSTDTSCPCRAPTTVAPAVRRGRASPAAAPRNTRKAETLGPTSRPTRSTRACRPFSTPLHNRVLVGPSMVCSWDCPYGRIAALRRAPTFGAAVPPLKLHVFLRRRQRGIMQKTPLFGRTAHSSLAPSLVHRNADRVVGDVIGPAPGGLASDVADGMWGNVLGAMDFAQSAVRASQGTSGAGQGHVLEIRHGAATTV